MQHGQAGFKTGGQKRKDAALYPARRVSMQTGSPASSPMVRSLVVHDSPTCQLPHHSPTMTLPADSGTTSWNPRTMMSAYPPPLPSLPSFNELSQSATFRPGGGFLPLTL